MSGGVPPNGQMTQQPADISQMVRNWVHYDNLATNFAKQSATSRKIREEYETRILAFLKAKQMENAVIQISGAKLQVVNEKTSPALTIGRLEQYLHAYFARKGQLADETAQIMQFIKQKKQDTFELVPRLKKIPLAPDVPPPPPNKA